MAYLFDSSALAAAFKAKRDEHPFYVIEMEIDIRSAELKRLENGEDIEMRTFLAVCSWLDIHPGDYFEFFG